MVSSRPLRRSLVVRTFMKICLLFFWHAQQWDERSSGYVYFQYYWILFWEFNLNVLQVCSCLLGFSSLNGTETASINIALLCVYPVLCKGNPGAHLVS